VISISHFFGFVKPPHVFGIKIGVLSALSDFKYMPFFPPRPSGTPQEGNFFMDIYLITTAASRLQRGEFFKGYFFVIAAKTAAKTHIAKKNPPHCVYNEGDFYLI